LLSPDATILVHTNPRWLGRKIVDESRGDKAGGWFKLGPEFVIDKKEFGQGSYIHPFTKQKYYTAFRTVEIDNTLRVGVFVQAIERDLLANVRRVQQRAIWLFGGTLFVTVVLGAFMFMQAVNQPLNVLIRVAQRIRSGDFKMDLKAGEAAEIGEFASTFNEFAQGLQERDQVKEVFNKFHSPEIVKAIMADGLSLQGHTLHATIVFIDLRGFTKISEEYPADEVVRQLNEYFECVVSVVTKNGGVVDKFVGDAVLALWGVPLGDEQRTEKALKACLDLRHELEALNHSRAAQGWPPLQIGMGVNDGEVVAGNIGSTSRMEFTVIGDAVNTASRVQTLAKDRKTDLLVTESVKQRVGARFKFGESETIQLRGKARDTVVYRVLGFEADESHEILDRKSA
jgi:adenylate cyclase